MWSDEFSETTLSDRNWTAADRSTFGDGNLELACLMNTPANIRLSEGVLALVARRSHAPARCGSHDARFPGGRSYTSALISTSGHADWLYGRFEIRARLPTSPGTSRGLWPAFWLRPTSGGTGEIDVLEAIGSGAAEEVRRVHQTIWYDYAKTYPPQAEAVDLPMDPSAGFHTYSVTWSPGHLTWQVDGRPTFQRDRRTTPWLDRAFDKPMFIRLNLAVGGLWPGPPDAATRFPAAFVVDYVRVYQR